MSSQLIREIALELFTKKGYEGASLANIAELVGIKKSSIYNHYKSKDDLFLTICETSYNTELLSTKNFFEKNKHKDVLSLLKGYLEFRALAIEHSLTTTFLFRFIAFPPHHLTEQLNSLKIDHFSHASATVIEAMLNHPSLQQKDEEVIRKLIKIYFTLIHGSMFETLLGRDLNIELKVDILWDSFQEQLHIQEKVLTQ
ncbi:MAG: TetR/AcrR family transcriptional regulator [Solibacillus sp.]